MWPPHGTRSPLDWADQKPRSTKYLNSIGGTIVLTVPSSGHPTSDVYKGVLQVQMRPAAFVPSNKALGGLDLVRYRVWFHGGCSMSSWSYYVVCRILIWKVSSERPRSWCDAVSPGHSNQPLTDGLQSWRSSVTKNKKWLDRSIPVVVRRNACIRLVRWGSISPYYDNPAWVTRSSLLLVNSA